MVFTAVLTPAEEGGFIAFNPETGTTTHDETVQEAVANLQEVTTLVSRGISNDGHGSSTRDHV
jgi:predicted RNase H-like HicB family nuclease